MKLLDFLRAKDEASFKDISWKNNILSFKIKSSITHPNDIAYLVPFINEGKKISKITSNGVTQHYTVRSIKGHKYALVTISPGSVYKIAISYSAISKN